MSFTSTSRRLSVKSLILGAMLALASCQSSEDESPLPFQGMRYKANGQQITVDFNQLRNQNYDPARITLVASSTDVLYTQPRFPLDSLQLTLSLPYLEYPDTFYLNQVSGNATRLELYRPGTSSRKAIWYARDYRGNRKDNYVIFDKVDGRNRVAGRFSMILINTDDPEYPDTMRVTDGYFNTFENIQKQ